MWPDFEHSIDPNTRSALPTTDVQDAIDIVHRSPIVGSGVRMNTTGIIPRQHAYLGTSDLHGDDRFRQDLAIRNLREEVYDIQEKIWEQLYRSNQSLRDEMLQSMRDMLQSFSLPSCNTPSPNQIDQSESFDQTIIRSKYLGYGAKSHGERCEEHIMIVTSINGWKMNYDGTDKSMSYHLYVATLRNCMHVMEMSEQQMLRYIFLTVRGAARTWWLCLDRKPMTFEEYLTELRLRFLPKKNKIAITMELCNLTYDPKTPIANHIDDMILRMSTHSFKWDEDDKIAIISQTLPPEQKYFLANYRSFNSNTRSNTSSQSKKSVQSAPKPSGNANKNQPSGWSWPTPTPYMGAQ